MGDGRKFLAPLLCLSLAGPAAAGGYTSLQDWTVRGDTASARTAPDLTLHREKFPLEFYALYDIPADSRIVGTINRWCETIGDSLLMGQVPVAPHRPPEPHRIVFKADPAVPAEIPRRAVFRIGASRHPTETDVSRIERLAREGPPSPPTPDSSAAGGELDRTLHSLNAAQKALSLGDDAAAIHFLSPLAKGANTYLGRRTALLLALAHAGSGDDSHLVDAARILARLGGLDADIVATRGHISFRLRRFREAGRDLMQAGKRLSDANLCLQAAHAYRLAIDLARARTAIDEAAAITGKSAPGPDRTILEARIRDARRLLEEKPRDIAQ